MTTLNDLTTEYIGPDATEADLEQFKGWARKLMEGRGLTEEQAVTYLWNDGDYIVLATASGLRTEETDQE